jgi:hypothetical protein
VHSEQADPNVAVQRIGSVLGGRYRLERLLGTGGEDAVYAARDPGAATSP